MTEYHVSPEAQLDLGEIYLRIVEDSISNADRVLSKLIEQFDRIAFMPGIGHIRPELDNDSLRVISVYRYLIIFDPMRNPLEIVRVIHSAMDLRKEFRREI